MKYLEDLLSKENLDVSKSDEARKKIAKAVHQTVLEHSAVSQTDIKYALVNLGLFRAGGFNINDVRRAIQPSQGNIYLGSIREVGTIPIFYALEQVYGLIETDKIIFCSDDPVFKVTKAEPIYFKDNKQLEGYIKARVKIETETVKRVTLQKDTSNQD